METGILYIVATPIGNLEDVTMRAIRVLKEVEVIFCEDTRVTRRLSDKYEITTPLKSMNANSEGRTVDAVLAYLTDGHNVAYVSDAGTPAISDPGSQLVVRAREVGIRVETVPGASAVIAALSIAGLDTTSFTYLGFLPHKKGRQTLLKEISEMKRTAVVYESTHRILKLLHELHDMGIDRRVCIARELTKVHEEVLCGSAAEVLGMLEKEPIKQKGEFVVIVSKNEKAVQESPLGMEEIRT